MCEWLSVSGHYFVLPRDGRHFPSLTLQIKAAGCISQIRVTTASYNCVRAHNGRAEKTPQHTTLCIDLRDRETGNSVFSSIMASNPWSAKVNNLNFYPLEVVGRYRDPQLQVGENYSYLLNVRLNIYKYGCLHTHLIPYKCDLKSNNTDKNDYRRA